MKHNRFSKCIERLLILLPLFYVAISSAYVIFNKNAKDSYYGENINDTIFVDTSFSDLQVNNNYQLIPFNNTEDSVTQTQFNVINVSTNVQDYPNVTKIMIYKTNILYVVGYVGNTPTYYWTSTNIIYFTFVSYIQNAMGNAYNYVTIQEITHNEYSYLNNVMTYSLSEFNKLGFGKLDFTSWFTNIFMNGNTNNVYVLFVNSYLNYFLMVECIYFIPMIIYWFIHFGESVVERFISKGDNW